MDGLTYSRPGSSPSLPKIFNVLHRYQMLLISTERAERAPYRDFISEDISQDYDDCVITMDENS